MSEFAREVWDTLSKVNVSEKIEKKGSLNYLSWAWAWGALKSAYPSSNYAFKEPIFYPDGSCEVWVNITISGEKEADIVSQDMWLPVMDNRNNAIKNPDARKISDTRMRCLAKAIAMCGLGHYIYAGEDLPSGDFDEVLKGYTSDQKEEFDMLIETEASLGMWEFRKTIGDETYSALNNSFDPGYKVANKNKLKSMEDAAYNKLSAYVVEMKNFIEADDHVGLNELSELSEAVKRHIFSQLTPEEQARLAEFKKEAA